MQPNQQQQMRNIMSRMEEKDKAGVPKEDFETARDIATDSIPGVSETKDIISLSSNIGKGDYLGAGIDATSLALGAVPVVGDIARKGFKSLVAKDIKKATEFLKDTNLIDKWKKDNPNPKPQKRNPDVEKAANELLDGKITGKQYRSIVKENMPIRKIDEVPEIPTFTEIVGSLTSDKSKKGILGLNKKIEDGTRVASRLDIPAYEKHDKWIVSVHDAKNKKGIEGLDGDIIGYGKTAVLKNVEFKSNPQAASKISAKRADKGTIARIFGDYVNADPDKVAVSAKKFLKDPEWTQVGYNPFRHGFFYDKNTGLPVKSAKEVLQVGPLVLAKNAKKFTISEAKKLGVKGGLKIRTSGKSQVVFNEGGVTMKKQMELFEDGGLKEEGGMVDEVSGNDVPVGSTREEVRDDIPAQLSEGEFVFPADVVRYIGLEKLMKLRQEAKQGLKQMEAMGQMGNSEEATMPDDLPFDETDLDIEDEEDVPFDETDLDTEDDLGYNIGGYVPPSYTPPVIQNIPQMNIPQFPAQPGVPPIPGMPQNINQPKLASFNQLMGGFGFNQDTQKPNLPQAELVRYVNKTTKQVRMIPHLNNPDGSRGDTLYPIPEGFVAEEEDPKKKAQKTTKVPTAKVDKVDSEEGGDDGGKGPGVTAVDPAGDALSYQSIGKKDALDKNMAKIANMQLGLLGIGKGGIKAGVIGKVGRGLLGKTDIEAINLGAITAYYTQSKKELGVYGKNVANLDTKTRNALSKSIDRAISSVVSLTTDANGNDMSTQDTISAVNDLADLYGVDKIDTRKRNWNLNVVIGKTIAEIDKERDKVRQRMIRRGLMTPQQGFNPEEALGIEGLSKAQQKGFMAALESGKGVNEYGGVSKDTLSDVQSIASQDQYSFDTVTTEGADPGSSASTDMGDATNKGSLITKRKASGKLKPKYMKRGGLASKK